MMQLLIPLLGRVLDSALPDPAAAAAAKLRVMELAQSGELAQLSADTDLAKAQIGVNAIDAASPSLFRGGWRPAAGWVCVGGLAYQLVARPLLSWVAVNLWGWSAPPSLEMEALLTILGGLLGLGTMRSRERLAGKA